MRYRRVTGTIRYERVLERLIHAQFRIWRERIDARPAGSIAFAPEAKLSEQPAVCEWSIDAEGTWGGTCGAAWCFNDGGPTENSMKFCPECGKPVKALPAKFDEWGDPIVGCDCDLLETPGSPEPCAEFQPTPNNPEFCATCTHVEECH